MTERFHLVVQRAVDEANLRADGRYTDPRSFGVYQLPFGAPSSTRFHHGNHPVRRQELEREFGSCTTVFLFHTKEDAASVSAALNGRDSGSP